MKTVLRIMLYAVGTMAICILLLMGTSCIPRSLIQKNSEKSAEYFGAREPFSTLAGNCVNTIQDNYSDTVLCDIVYCIDTSKPFSSVIEAKYVQGDNEDAFWGYLRAVHGEDEATREYGRYWHGSMVLLRPLLMIMPISGIRVLFGGATILIQLFIAFLYLKRRNKAFAICYLISFLMIHPWMLLTSLEYSTAFLTASAASLALILKYNRSDDGMMPFFAIVGVITCFVDFLTTETITFTLPMLLLLTERSAERHSSKTGSSDVHIGAKGGCLSVIKNGLCWIGGYLGMFFLKLGLLFVVAGEEVMQSSLNEGLFRLGGEVRKGNISTAPVVDFGKQISGAVWHNLACLYPVSGGEMKAGGVWIMTLLIVVVGMSIVYLLREKIDWEYYLPLGLTAVIPYLRFLVLSNHSYEHFFITYRAQMVTITAFLFFVYANGIGYLIKGKIFKERKGAVTW